MNMSVSSKRKFSKLEHIVDFWLDTRENSIIFDYMKENDIDQLTIEIISKYTFELKKNA